MEDGPQTLAATMGSIRESDGLYSGLLQRKRVELNETGFDVIFCDMHMPVVNGEQVARMIRSTNNHNQNTPSEFGAFCNGGSGDSAPTSQSLC